MFASAFAVSSSYSAEQEASARDSSIIVAVDRDKNSQQAAKWAVDKLLSRGSTLTLVHVRAEGGKDEGDAEITQLFISYRGYCARKGMHLKEVILDNSDISKAIIEYATSNAITDIVVGASTKNTFIRRFRNPDVPTCLMKMAPDYCTVHVIHKAKAIQVKAAKAPAPFPTLPPKQYSQPIIESDVTRPSRGDWKKTSHSHTSSPMASRNSVDRLSAYAKAPSRDRPLTGARTAPQKDFDDYIDFIAPPRPSVTRSSFSDDIDLAMSMELPSIDFAESMELSSAMSMESLSSAGDVEAEMRRLRLELKQTMEMYNSACKEAIDAKQKAAQMHQMKMEESKKFQELRNAEEEALALVQMEKAKCRAALEAAEAAQKIAELEAQKRLRAEWKAKREAEDRKKATDALNKNDLRYRRYSIDDIEAATHKFDKALKIGEGGYGPVYKAVLDHTNVAIKILRPDASQGRKQFQQEIEVLSCMRHPNMVLLLGACPEYGCLVYEYMDYGSLEDRLCRRGKTLPIPWSIRFRIAADIATGLLFLHQAKPEPLVHRDLKPANILLDHNFVSKISDVGLARLVPQSAADVTQYRMTSTAGTFCYIDPEYQQTGMLTTKSDIYSLGIMLLQIITARSPMGLTHHVENSIERGTFQEILDPTVTDWPVEEALEFAKLALRCAELRKKDRPDLGKEILPELNRLRNLGHEYEASQVSSASTNCSSSAPYSFNNDDI
ncbi:U-box domain-containing protein 52-like isoform X2 [Panicum virgatum]|uniref:U-box domain-containing protein 52-like isoform X2 n=1 Tax=Panicum virgatum TaxID=38727 RepID=UPI0019D5B754|nr:U-box domain-containing protein 52-like isoform X2 [Panicum virgatum]